MIIKKYPKNKPSASKVERFACLVYLTMAGW